ncbi:hypothetical protein [Alteribacter natronophilus]|uniref:hypothetical protein n=1 Tax=Alteribacter natronophilus TaxID=2583810 RepID=UPI00110EB91E|nr:hypothetical protein [Alteribacter natronophilus]TMW71472.1 hypothetical protein FGB90_10535 [Alteribacter natronophilus]
MERIRIINGLDFFGYHLCEEAIARGIEIILAEDGKLTEEQEMIKALFARNSLVSFEEKEADVTLVNEYERAGKYPGEAVVAGREEGDILLPPLYGPFQPEDGGFAALISGAEKSVSRFREWTLSEGKGLVHAGDAAEAVLDLLEMKEKLYVRITENMPDTWEKGVRFLADRFEELDWCRELLEEESDGHGETEGVGRTEANGEKEGGPSDPEGDEQKKNGSDEMKRLVVKVSGRPLEKGLEEQIAWMDKTGSGRKGG